MRRYDLGDPISLQHFVTDATGTPVAATATLHVVKPSGEAADPTVTSPSTGVLTAVVPAVEADEDGPYRYTWSVTGVVQDTVSGKFYVGADAEDGEIPPLAPFELLVAKIGYTPEGYERGRAEDLLDESSELIRDIAGKTWVDTEGVVSGVPRRMQRICVAAAYRGFTNPEGLSQRQIGDSLKGYDRAGVGGGEAVYLTPREEKSVRALGGVDTSFVSVGLMTPYSGGYIGEDEVIWA
jgi:hypothetical protein